MTITKDQAQMLTSLAIASRPHRAPTWDEAGVMAAIAEIRHMSLPEVILRVIRAAADRDAVTPGVIPKNGPHANEVLKPPKWEPTVLEPGERCSVCSQDPIGCEARRVNQRGMDPDDPRFDDHTFSADFKHKRDGEAVALIVASIKADVAPSPVVAEPKSLDELLPAERNPSARVARDQIAAAQGGAELKESHV